VFGLRIKDPLAPSVSPGFYSQIDRGGGGLSTWYQSRGPGFDPAQPDIFAALIPPSLARSPYGGALLDTHMARAATAHTQ
jgi:hypothetical protein